LQSRLAEIRRLDGEVLAISVDPVERAREIVEAHGLEFALLSDPQAAVVREYGVLHEGGGPFGDIARPACFLLDRQGRIVWRDLTENWRVRVRPDRVLDQLARLR
jgi:peroxiredoxin